MNKFLDRLKPRSSRRSLADQSDSWRQVPRISITPTVELHHTSPVVVGVLVLILLIELFFIFNRFNELNNTRVGVVTLSADLEKAVVAEDDEAFRVQELTEQLDSMNAARDKITNTYRQISSSHVLWGEALTPLFDFEIPGLFLTLVTSDPEIRQVVVTSVAQDVSDAGSYRAHVVEVADSPLDLVSESIQLIEGNLQVVGEANVFPSSVERSTEDRPTTNRLLRNPQALGGAMNQHLFGFIQLQHDISYHNRHEEVDDTANRAACPACSGAYGSLHFFSWFPWVDVPAATASRACLHADEIFTR
ncbi:MAG: hypothetical protein IIA73_10645 [Proteobacteria bacterium]|nr:hypothetical protein [Pseudomonadota bacterium]